MSGIPADGQDPLTKEHRGTVRAGNIASADGVTTKGDGGVADGMTMMTIEAIMAAAMPTDTTDNAPLVLLHKDQPGISAGLIRLSLDDESPGDFYGAF